MQKISIALVLALTVACAVAGYNVNPSGYAKAPLDVAVDINLTNATFFGWTTLFPSTPTLEGRPHIVITNTSNLSSLPVQVYTQKLDTKALGVTANNSYTYTQTISSTEYNGYAIGLMRENDTNNVPQIFFYQTDVQKGTVLPKVCLTSNTNNTFNPSSFGIYPADKTIYVLVGAAEKIVNVTSISLGGNKAGTEFTLTRNKTGFDSIQVTGGEALSSNAFLASWTEGDVLKQAVVDGSKANVSVVDVAGYKTQFSCSPFATDKKVYGTACTNRTTSGNVTTFDIYTSINSTGLFLLTSIPFNSSHQFSVDQYIPYAGYLAIFTSNCSMDVNSTTTMSVEIWDVEKSVTTKNRTDYLTMTTGSSAIMYRVPAGGVYNLIFSRVNETVPRTEVKVGVVLSGSYITSVFGFILATIAGLLLF